MECLLSFISYIEASNQAVLDEVAIIRQMIGEEDELKVKYISEVN